MRNIDTVAVIRRLVANTIGDGLRQIVDNLPKYARFECPDGNSTFSIHLVEKLPEGHGVVIYFECDDLDQTVQKLKHDGIEFSSDPQDQPGYGVKHI